MDVVCKIDKYSPNGRTALCFLETQSHVYSTRLGPHNKRICIYISHLSQYSQSPFGSPCCFWYRSSFVILVSRSNRSGLSSDSTYIFDSSYAHISVLLSWWLHKTFGQGNHERSISFLMAAYVDDAAGAKSSPPIEPVIVFELIHLHPLLLVRGRHYQRHNLN